MGYSVDAELTDCYEGTSCLINKFNITDENKLSNVEAAITFAKISQLEKNPIDGNFDLNHYKEIHRFREGNGRTQRVFIEQLIRKNGYIINFSSIDPDELMIATIQSASGIRDNLLEIFNQNII